VNERDLEGRSFFITGVSSGIGRSTALALGRRGATLSLAGRPSEATQSVVRQIRDGGNATVAFFPLLLDDLSSVRSSAHAFLATGAPLDVLINNAGVAGQRGITRDGFELTFGINHLGHFLLTQLLEPRLIESARGKAEPGRIVNVSSIAHYDARQIDWDALRRTTRSRTGMLEYRVSKLCNILHARSMASRLSASNVHSYSLHPGVIASEIWREVPWPFRSLIKAFMQTSEQGAETGLFCATSRQAAGETGLYYDTCRAVEPSPLARDAALAEELFARSLRWTGMAAS
jgi:NAD(P)-dependent dehydrogenase (short-subunit alcohol dehydrogenase family)